MKKILLLLLVTTFTSPVFAQVPKSVPSKPVPQKQGSKNDGKSYKVNCFVTDDRDGDRTVIDKTFTIYANDGAGIVENFYVAESDHRLQFVLVYEGEEGLFYLGINDVDAKVTAQNVNHIPDNMYVFLGSEDVGVIAQCNINQPKMVPTPPQQLPHKN